LEIKSKKRNNRNFKTKLLLPTTTRNIPEKNGKSQLTR